MKNIKVLLMGALTAGMLTGCVSDDDFVLAPFDEALYMENFQDAVDNTTLDTEGWINIAEIGNMLWTEQVYSGNGYAEFSTYNSGDAVNVGWLISPEINIDESSSKILNFETAQHHLETLDNSLEIFISEDFDGTNLETATWTQVDATLPVVADSWYEFIPSGDVDLSAFSGNIRVAFKVTGSGTDQTLDGAYQIDNFKIIK